MKRWYVKKLRPGQLNSVPRRWVVMVLEEGDDLDATIGGYFDSWLGAMDYVNVDIENDYNLLGE